MKENDKHYTNISKYAVTEQVYSNTPKCIMEGKITSCSITSLPPHLKYNENNHHTLVVYSLSDF